MYNFPPGEPQREGSPLKNPPVVERLVIRYQDLGPYGHVNNAVCLEFFETIGIAYWRALAGVIVPES